PAPKPHAAPIRDAGGAILVAERRPVEFVDDPVVLGQHQIPGARKPEIVLVPGDRNDVVPRLTLDFEKALALEIGEPDIATQPDASARIFEQRLSSGGRQSGLVPVKAILSVSPT